MNVRVRTRKLGKERGAQRSEGLRIPTRLRYSRFQVLFRIRQHGLDER